MPKKFYRVHCEHSFTAYHPINPQEESEFAFQAQGLLDCIQELTKERIERHLNWHDKTASPSSYISVFDNYGYNTPSISTWSEANSKSGKAKNRARFHFDEAPSSWRARQILIAAINTSHLEQAVLKPPNSGTAIPIWVDKTYLDKSIIPMSAEDLEGRIHVWVSIAEIRPIFGIPWGKGQDDEWLAYRRIPWNKVDCVMPYDGSKLYTTPGDKIKLDGWDFDWRVKSWIIADAYGGFVDEDKNHEQKRKNERSTSTPLQLSLPAARASAAALQNSATGLESLASTSHIHISDETETEDISSRLTRVNLTEND